MISRICFRFGWFYCLTSLFSKELSLKIEKWLPVCQYLGRAGRNLAQQQEIAKLPRPLGCCSNASETEITRRGIHQFSHLSCVSADVAMLYL